MGHSPLGKLRDILKAPEVPAHLRAQQYAKPPLSRRILDAIRPPSSVPGTRPPMNHSQLRMILISLAILIPVIVVWGVIDYVSGAPGRARVALEDGMLSLGANDFASAITKFSNSIDTFPTAEAYLERGNAYEGLKQSENALADWERAISHDSTLYAAYTARATHYRLSGDAAKALPDLDQSIRLRPSVDGYFQRGQVYAAIGRYEKAVEDYDRSILERREAPYVYLARSIAKRALGDEEGYRADQQKAAELQRIP
jgi:tetratricopeptide (TPR) repeat protein